MIFKSNNKISTMIQTFSLSKLAFKFHEKVFFLRIIVVGPLNTLRIPIIFQTFLINIHILINFFKIVLKLLRIEYTLNWSYNILIDIEFGFKIYIWIWVDMWITLIEFSDLGFYLFFKMFIYIPIILFRDIFYKNWIMFNRGSIF